MSAKEPLQLADETQVDVVGLHHGFNQKRSWQTKT
jgi:hypothetical protein